MNPFEELTELAAGGRFGELDPNIAVRFTVDALSDTSFLEKQAGAKGLNSAAMFNHAMGLYTAQRYPMLAKTASDKLSTEDQRYDTAKLATMASHLNMSDSDLGSAMASVQLGDNSPMNQIRERFYFG